MLFNTLDEILTDLKNGKIVCLADSAELENEIDMMVLAEFATPQNINYLARNACGFICAVLPDEICEAKGIDYLEQKGTNKDHRGTPWARFLDEKGCDTGISAYERSYTITELACSDKDLTHFVNGHVPVLRARKGLLDERLGHTEMSAQLSFLADSNGTAVICEILAEDGHMLRVKDFEEWNKDKGLKLYSIDKLLNYLRFDKAIDRILDSE